MDHKQGMAFLECDYAPFERLLEDVPQFLPVPAVVDTHPPAHPHCVGIYDKDRGTCRIEHYGMGGFSSYALT
jgi:hypothetical protein